MEPTNNLRDNFLAAMRVRAETDGGTSQQYQLHYYEHDKKFWGVDLNPIIFVAGNTAQLWLVIRDYLLKHTKVEYPPDTPFDLCPDEGDLACCLEENGYEPVSANIKEAVEEQLSSLFDNDTLWVTKAEQGAKIIVYAPLRTALYSN